MSGMPFLFADFISFFRFTVFVFSILPSIVRNWFMTSCETDHTNLEKLISYL